jgi:hypothetical protein
MYFKNLVNDMAILIQILTDLRVKELLPILLEIPKLSFVKEIDSVNYGEGFDIKYGNLEIRLYDNQRSDEAMIDTEFLNGKINWDQAFEKVVNKFKGQVFLNIEIDRLDEQPKDERLDAAMKISGFLNERNYESSVEIFGTD